MTDSEHDLFMEKAVNDEVFHKKALLLFGLYATDLGFFELLEHYKKEYIVKKADKSN